MGMDIKSDTTRVTFSVTIIILLYLVNVCAHVTKKMVSVDIKEKKLKSGTFIYI